MRVTVQSGYTGDGGQATAAQLTGPGGVLVDSSGNLFIADTQNSVIREVNPTSHVITTYAGADGGLVYSNDDGPATSATLANPDGVVVDSQGDIFIADEFFNAVREVNATTGLMTTIAGNGTYGYRGDGGPATAAELADPAGLAIEGGNLYIADSGNNVIREVNLTTGVITTVAGDGTYGDSGDGGKATAAELSNPLGVAVDSSGNIYIADEYDNAIREVNAATGDISTIAGDGTYGYSGDGGQATDAELSDPSGVALDGSGDLFIADTDNDVIREVNLTSGAITTVAGIGGDNNYGGDGGFPTAATLDGPSDLAVNSAGTVYVADTFNNVIRGFTTTTGGQTVTVAKAVLTITADSTSKLQGNTLILGGTTFTETGLVTANGDTISSVTLTSGGTSSSAAAGSYPIVPSAAVGSGLSNYKIVYDNGALTVTPTPTPIPTPIPTPTPSPTPTHTVVLSEHPVFTRKLNKKGKPVGKALLSGFTIDFGVALNTTTAGNSSEYQLDTVTTKKVRKKPPLRILHPITNFTAKYVAASSSVQITFGAKETFPTGGQLTVLGGMTTAAGGTLTGNAVYTISKGGKNISPSS